MAATGDLRRVEGRRTEVGRPVLLRGAGEPDAEAVTVDPPGVESGRMRGEVTEDDGTRAGGYGGEVCGGRSSIFSVEAEAEEGGIADAARMLAAAPPRLLGTASDDGRTSSPGPKGDAAGTSSTEGETMTGMRSDERSTADVRRGEAL